MIALHRTEFVVFGEHHGKSCQCAVGYASPNDSERCSKRSPFFKQQVDLLRAETIEFWKHWVYTVRLFRPFLRRAASTFLPPTDFDRFRKPCVRARFRFFSFANIVKIDDIAFVTATAAYRGLLSMSIISHHYVENVLRYVYSLA